MRIKVIGDCLAAKVLRGYLRKSDCALVSTLPDYTVYLDEDVSVQNVTIDSIDSILERNAINLMYELGVPEFTLKRAKGIQSDSEIRVTYPPKFERQVELGLYRTLTHDKRDRKTKATRTFRKYAAPVVLWLSFVLLSSLAHSDDLPRGFIRTHPILFQPTNFPIVRFWDGSTIQNATFTGGSLNINCTGGCGGAATFADSSAFTFGTTSINNSGFVVDDVGTNAVAENSAGAARMTGQRILYIDISKTLANTNKLLVTPDSVALPANQSVNVAQFGANNIVTGTGASGVGIPRVTVSNDSSLAANQSVNTAQFGGTNISTGTGVGGVGIPRVTISNDSSLAANQSVNVAQIAGTNTVTAAAGVQKVGIVGNANGIIDAADNATPPANEIAVGLLAVGIGVQPTNKTGGNLVRQLSSTEGVTYVQEGNSNRFSCFINGVTVTTQCQAAPGAGLRAYVTSATMSSQSTTAVQLDIVYGTGANCATGITAITHKIQFGTASLTTSPQSYTMSFTTPLVPVAANAICVRPSAAGAFGATLTGYIAP